jgi:hypothetical protein
MTTSFSGRRALAAASIVTATAGALLLPAAPASASPVDGYLGAFGYARTADDASCTVDPADPADATKVFTPATGRRTARVAQGYVARDGAIAARGRVENATSGVADARNGAFDDVHITADHLVRVNDVGATDCGLGIIADSQSGADLKVGRRGRIHLEWDRGRSGQIEQIFVSRNGTPVVDRIRPRAHGSLTFNVRRGTYVLFVQFVTRVNERDIPTGQTLTKRAHYSVVADYRR